MAPFFDPSSFIALLMLVLGGGVRDLAGTVSTDTYWKSKNVTVSVAQLTHELDPPAPADISKLIPDLDGDDPKVRETATEKIFQIGPGALAVLEETARDGSPEASARAARLLVRIRAAAKPAAVRRLMAIRTLGEMKQPAALAVLRPLVDSKTTFEADYARSAIAKIEGKPFATPPATDADRASDVNVLPARLDVVAQLAPAPNDASLTIETVVAELPIKPERRTAMRDEATRQVLNMLDVLGNVRIDLVTFGFYAAPPNVPGNGCLVIRGEFDAVAVSALLAQAAKNSDKISGSNVFHFDSETALLVASNRRIVFLFCQAKGDLGIETMAAALKSGAGDFSTNTEMVNLLKSVDRTTPLWGAARLTPGLREISGPVSNFDTLTLTARQTRDKDILVTDMRLEAIASDKAQAQQSAVNLRDELRTEAAQGRKEEQKKPWLKPLVDLVESMKTEADGTKMTVTGSLRGLPIAAMVMGMRMEEQDVVVQPAPAPVKQR